MPENTSQDDEYAGLRLQKVPLYPDLPAQPSGRAPFLLRCHLSVVTIIATVGSSTFVASFTKTFASKAAEDCYQGLRHLACRRRKQPVDMDIARLTNPDSGTELVYMPPLPDEAIVKLAALKPRKTANRLLTWDGTHEKWDIGRKHRSSA